MLSSCLQPVLPIGGSGIKHDTIDAEPVQWALMKVEGLPDGNSRRRRKFGCHLFISLKAVFYAHFDWKKPRDPAQRMRFQWVFNVFFFNGFLMEWNGIIIHLMGDTLW